MSRQVVLSARMQAVADLVTTGNRVCDVGCDHGYISIYLVQNRKAPCVLAMDVNKGPLQRASEHIKAAGLEKYITLRLSDGLTAFRKGEADTLVCAGMGGRLMQRILEREPDKTFSFQELVLQPQSEIGEFRRFLEKMGYSTEDEDMILEEGKFYPVIKAIRGKAARPMTQVQARFGPVLLEKKHTVLMKFLEREWNSCLAISSELAHAEGGPRIEERRRELEQDMGYLRQAAGYMGMEELHGYTYD